MKRTKSIFLLLCGVFIIVFIVHQAGITDIINVLSQVDLPMVVAAFFCQIGALLLWALRWKILLRSFGPVPFKTSLIGIIIGVFFNNITPIAKAGGEPFRAYYMGGKQGVEFEDVFATVAIDRVLESFSFLFIILITFAYFTVRLKISGEMILIIFLALLLNVILLSLVLYFSFSLKAAKKLMFSLLRFIARFSNRLEKYESQIEEAVEQYHTSIKMLSSQESTLVTCLAISGGFWFLVILRNYLVVSALGYDVHFMVIAVVQMVGTLAGIFPVFPGGLGSTDSIMIFLYYSFDFPVAVAVTASLVDRFISFWLMTVIGAVIVFIERGFLEGSRTT